MSHQAVFIQVGALADGFAPDNDALPAYSGLAHHIGHFILQMEM